MSKTEERSGLSIKWESKVIESQTVPYRITNPKRRNSYQKPEMEVRDLKDGERIEDKDRYIDRQEATAPMSKSGHLAEYWRVYYTTEYSINILLISTNEVWRRKTGRCQQACRITELFISEMHARKIRATEKQCIRFSNIYSSA